MKYYILPGRGIASRRDFHSRLADLMDFPDYYGKNLDALKDVLTDISEETCLEITETGIMQENLGTYYRSLLRVLKDAADDNPMFTYHLDAEEEKE